MCTTLDVRELTQRLRVSLSISTGDLLKHTGTRKSLTFPAAATGPHTSLYEHLDLLARERVGASTLPEKVIDVALAPARFVLNLSIEQLTGRAHFKQRPRRQPDEQEMEDIAGEVEQMAMVSFTFHTCLNSPRSTLDFIAFLLLFDYSIARL
jgi:hypothetical protein